MTIPATPTSTEPKAEAETEQRKERGEERASERTPTTTSDLHITQVSPFFTPHIGGVESHVLALSRWLVTEGYRVTVVSSKLGDEPAEEFIDGIHVIRLEPLAEVFSTPINYQFRRRLVQLETDIVHAHSPPPLTEVSAARAAEELGVPFVLTYHCDLELPSPLGTLLTELYRRTLGLYALRKADAIITTTDSYHATSRSVWAYEPVVIPNAINADLFNPEISGEQIRERYALEDSKIVLFVGRLRRHKGLEFLIESARYVDDDVRYIIVGSGDFRPAMEKMIHDLGLDDTVILAGRVPDEELPYYYGACDVFVLPSVSRLEAFGIVGLEAMATATPTVVSNIPGVCEVIEDGKEGLLAEPMNARALAEKLGILLSDAERRKKMGEQGRATVVNKFHWGEVVKQFTALYERLAAGTQRRRGTEG